MNDYDPLTIEARWQREWDGARLFEPKREEGRRKFFIIFAYPGISGFLHVGHMRGYSYCDAIARYHRQLGENVLFPAGFHASGIPAVSYARKVERGDEPTLATLREEGVDGATVARLKDPAFVVSFFTKVYEERYWRKFGFSIDYTRLATTTDAAYGRFIEWQFRKLNQNGLLVQKPHFAPFCPASGPVAVDASETDVSKGGDAEVLAFSALKFRAQEGVVFPTATLRPETVFGVTNLWVNPSVEYVLADVQGERWVLSPEAAQKADLLFEAGAKVVGKVQGRDLVGKAVRVPLSERSVVVLPASFVDPAVGTGVVMSVPGHAPYDLAALEELHRHPAGLNPALLQGLQPIVIVRSPGGAPGGPSPAEAAMRAHKVTSTLDREALDKATDDVYTLEFHQGRMLENTGAFAGMLCSEAREKLVSESSEAGEACAFPAFSKEVICRCGQQVLIKRIPDQWFIRYSDQKLTEASARHAETMHVTPPEYARDLPSTLRWFADRACTRQGAWLGTRFPIDERWIIEPISDSTLYPAFYIVAPYVNGETLKAEALGEAFFDFVFLGRGEAGRLPGVSPAVAEACRRDFLYWYPLDINLGGKEHKTVHFPAFVKAHVGVLQEPHWPRGIFVNFWVTSPQGEKLSKSKGGAQPVAELAATFGVDALRLYYAHAAAAWLDIEWDPDAVIDYRQRLGRVHDLGRALASGDLAGAGANEQLPAPDSLDAWLGSVFSRRLLEAEEGWRSLDLRAVAGPIYFGVLSDLRWYLRRGGRNLRLLKELAGQWVTAMGPVTPHLAEELHRALGMPGFASLQVMPRSDLAKRDGNAEAVEAYLESVLTDTGRIRQIAESFQLQGEVARVVQRAAGKTVRGELVGRAEPLAIPSACDRDAQVGNEKVPLLLSKSGLRIGVFVQARRAASAEDVEKAARLVAGGALTQAWVVAAIGAPSGVRARAHELGVLLTGPAQFEILAEETGGRLERGSAKRITLVSAQPWKRAALASVFEDAQAHGKSDAGRVLKALAADGAFKAHMKLAPKLVQEAVKEAGSMKPADLKARAESARTFDEYRVLKENEAFLASEFGCPVEVMSADNPEAQAERVRGKAQAAVPMRPAIVVDY